MAKSAGDDAQWTATVATIRHADRVRRWTAQSSVIENAMLVGAVVSIVTAMAESELMWSTHAAAARVPLKIVLTATSVLLIAALAWRYGAYEVVEDQRWSSGLRPSPVHSAGMPGPRGDRSTPSRHAVRVPVLAALVVRLSHLPRLRDSPCETHASSGILLHQAISARVNCLHVPRPRMGQRPRPPKPPAPPAASSHQSRALPRRPARYVFSFRSNSSLSSYCGLVL
jgi:hypothetical protein